MSPKKKNSLRLFFISAFFILPSVLSVPRAYAEDSTTETENPSYSGCNLMTDDDLAFYAKNNILYYCPSTSFSCVNGGEVTVYGKTAKEKIWVGLTSFMTEEQAAGVMGNMQGESGFNPARHEDSQRSAHPNMNLKEDVSTPYGLGLIQWSWGRRTGMYSFIEENEPSLLIFLNTPEKYSDGRISGDKFIELAGDEAANALISLELTYLKQELDTKSTYNGIYSQGTVYDAAKFFLEKVEVPNNPKIEHHQDRATNAQAIYEEFHSKTINKDSSTPTSGACASGLAAYIILYAWPKVNHHGDTTKKPEYAEAVARREGKKYVGTRAAGLVGVDCGGFVTTLMQESGYEPDYNARGGNTSTQEAWAKSHWVALNPGGNIIDTSTLQIGDVAFVSCNGSGHTWVYADIIEGWNDNVAKGEKHRVASASLRQRAPSIGSEGLKTGKASSSASCPSTTVRWYRKAG